MSCAVHPPWPGTVKQLRLADVCLDLRYRRVERDGECIELPQRMFDLLLLFAAEPGILHERSDLFRRIWTGVIVEDGNLSQSVWMLRKALGESRRHWLRTVAKRGYVFEPPTPVQAVVDIDGEQAPVPSVPALPPAGTAPPLTPVTSELLPSSRPGRRVLSWLAAAAVLLCVLGLLVYPHAGDVAVPDSPTAVSLIVLADQADRAGAVPAGLLEAWLAWQLSLSPDVLLLSPAHLAADSDKQDSTRLITLSAGPMAGESGRLYVQAAFQGGDTLRVEGAQEQMSFLVDSLARKVRDSLLPTRGGQSWPALQVTADTAERYLHMRRARNARQWSQAATMGEALLADSPHFGLGWFELAQVQGMLGRTQLAQSSLETARSLLSPLPEDIGWLFDAQRLALGTDHEAAVAAYSELAREYPHQPHFALELARAQIRAGQYSQALTLLSPDVWTRQPTSVRISQLLVRGDAEQAMGDGEAARASALQADAIAERAGWIYERGWATLLLAQSNALEQRAAADMSLFNTAADYFEQAGDDLHALRARLLAASFSDGVAVSDEQLDALLERAREVGHPRMAMHALRAVAYRHYRDGRLEAYRLRLRQAEELAQSANDQHALALFDIDRVNEDIMSGDLRQAGHRLDRIRRAGGMQGDAGQWLTYFDAYLAYREGRLDDALRRLDDYGDGEPLAAVPADLQHCLTGAIAHVRADSTQARERYTRCGDSHVPVVALAAGLGLAQVDVHEADPGSARARARSVLARLHELDSVPDRWLVELDAAGVLLRAGDRQQAGAIYQRLLAALSGSGFRLMELDAVIGLAETALLDGDLAMVRQRVEQAEGLLLARDWLLESRLSLVRVVHAEAVGEHNAAAGHLHRLDRQAHRLGDGRVQALSHQLFRALAISNACDGGSDVADAADVTAGESNWLLSAMPLRLVDAGPGG